MKGFCGGVGTQTLDAGKGREKERKKERETNVGPEILFGCEYEQ